MDANEIFGIFRLKGFKLFQESWTHYAWPFVLSLIFCQVAGSRRRIPFSNHFVPLEPAILNNTITNYTAVAGETAVLYCAVTNLGTKTVTWRKASPSVPLTVGLFTYYGDPRFQTHHVIHKSQWNLHIRNVSMRDSGGYECQVSTRTRDIRRAFFLSVREQTSSIHITGDTYVNKNEKLVLFCNASSDSYPPDELDWFMNGLKILTDPEEGIKITNSVSLKRRTIWSKLVIEHAHMNHGGTYICRTSDKLVTNIKVNVLSDDKTNVKRGTNFKTFISSVRRSNSHGVSTHRTESWIILFLCSSIIFTIV
ncbi:hemicentin-1-like [Saccostrea echinata]|uniref:hemicentin-1-like n=1 Tax=Saccostrea echinata TaxID=191078 RepID=UPI002A7F2DA5|nr:hemicentin-1-like [Saccostrea echinata]